jgi:hypothetical protein
MPNSFSVFSPHLTGHVGLDLGRLNLNNMNIIFIFYTSVLNLPAPGDWSNRHVDSDLLENNKDDVKGEVDCHKK